MPVCILCEESFEAEIKNQHGVRICCDDCRIKMRKDPVLRKLYGNLHSQRRYHEQEAVKERIRKNSLKHIKVKRSKLRRIRDEHKAAGCSECGKTEGRMDFHHPDPENKLFAIARGVSNGVKEEVLLAEIAKCVVLCFYCHMKLHHFLPKGSS